jgi:hypothetical protein
MIECSPGPKEHQMKATLTGVGCLIIFICAGMPKFSIAPASLFVWSSLLQKLPKSKKHRIGTCKKQVFVASMNVFTLSEGIFQKRDSITSATVSQKLARTLHAGFT